MESKIELHRRKIRNGLRKQAAIAKARTWAKLSTPHNTGFKSYDIEGYDCKYGYKQGEMFTFAAQSDVGKSIYWNTFNV